MLPLRQKGATFESRNYAGTCICPIESISCCFVCGSFIFRRTRILGRELFSPLSVQQSHANGEGGPRTRGTGIKGCASRRKERTHLLCAAAKSISNCATGRPWIAHCAGTWNYVINKVLRLFLVCSWSFVVVAILWYTIQPCYKYKIEIKIKSGPRATCTTKTYRSQVQERALTTAGTTWSRTAPKCYN